MASDTVFEEWNSMKPRSFKLRLALWSVFTSGIMLIALAAIFMTAIRRIGMERIDRELQALGDANVRGPQPHWHWSRFDESLASMYGEDKTSPFVMNVYDRDGRAVYTSPRWPVAISATTLGIHEIAGPGKEPDLVLPRFVPGFGLPPLTRKPPPPPRMPMIPPRWLTVKEQGHAWRFVVMRNEHVTLVLGMDLADFHAEIRRFCNIVVVTAPLLLLLLAVAGGLLAEQAIRPVKTLTQVAQGITAKGLSRRVSLSDADHEFQALIDVINDMLDRLERSFQQATRFSADAAHELKTPLTILQGQLQQALRDAPPDSPEQRKYAELIEEVQRLKVIVRKLLLLAQADSGQIRLSLERVNISGEIEALADDVQQAGTGLSTERNVTPGVFVMADPDLLRQALQNLAGNAIKHNRKNGSVSLCLCTRNGSAVFTISNTFNPETRIDPERLFERFYRGNKARTRDVDSVGLGLSLAREIARAHQGDVILRECRENSVTFEMILPSAFLDLPHF